MFVEALKLLHVHGPLKGRRVSSMSCSGGEASLAADLAAAHGLETPPLPDTARAQLAAVLGPRVSVGNPLDYHTYIWGDRAAQAACFSAMLRAGFDMNLLVLDFPRDDRCDGATWETTMRAFADAQAATGAPAALVASLPETLPEANGAWLIERGIAPMQGMGDAFAALGLAAGIGEAWLDEKPAPLKTVRPLPPGREQLDDRKARDLLRSLDIRLPYCRSVSPHRAVEAARHIGYPVAMKAVVEGVAHKTELGGVVLDLRTDRDVRDAAQHLGRLSHKVLVESMIEGAVAELIVGISRDAQFGPALTIGAGGTLVELVDDTATLLLPASRDEIAGALLSLRVARLLAGFRGRPAGDIAATIDAIASVAKRASIAASRIAELDINPLLVMPERRGVFAVDVFVRLFVRAAP